MTDLTTLTEDELDLERASRHDAYSRVYYKLSSTTVADEDRFPHVLVPGFVKLVVRASYNQALTEAHVFAVAYVKEMNAAGSTWREFFSLEDQTLKTEAEVRYLAHEAIVTFRNDVEIIRELQRRSAIRRAAKQALIHIPVAVDTEYI